MSYSAIVIGALFTAGLAGWLFFGAGKDEPEEGGPETGTFRCKVCGHVSHEFLAAHTHATGSHELQGQHIDDSIERG